MYTLKLTESELEVLITFYEMGKNNFPKMDTQAIEIIKHVHKKDDLETTQDVVWLKLQDAIDPEGLYAKADYDFLEEQL